MILHSDEEIAKDIIIVHKDSGLEIENVFYADFNNNFVIKYTFNSQGEMVTDGWGIVPFLYRAKIIPVYKGE